MRQGKCGCWQSTEPKRRPWYYKPGDWTSWKPISRGGDEWCRWTLVLGVGPITGVLVVPLRQCRGCEDCGPQILDGCGYPHPLTSNEAAEALERDRIAQAEWERCNGEALIRDSAGIKAMGE